MIFTVIALPVSLAGAARMSSSGEGFHYSALQICVASILGIVLATSFIMHRLVLNWIDRADLPDGVKYASVHTIVCHACLGVAAKDLQGGRWTKDRCGGDQQWRPRLSGRGWTDRRRSG
jgi:hypothetical protein